MKIRKKLMAKKKNIKISDFVESEFEIIKSCETIGGVLTHLPNLFEKIKSLHETNIILYNLQKQLYEQNQIAFENIQQAVEWIHSKINHLKILLKKNHLTTESKERIQKIDSILKYNFVFSSHGYLNHIMEELLILTIWFVEKYPKHHQKLQPWVTIKAAPYNEYYTTINYPNFIDTKTESLEKQIQSWKEKTDFSILELYKFLKILSQYDSFIPLQINIKTWTQPKNLQELLNKLYQAYVGYYLSLFKSPDVSKHPLAIKDLIKLITRFLFMLNKEIFDPTLKGPTLQKFSSKEAEKYCVETLVNHMSSLSSNKLEAFKKNKYDVEILDFLKQEAKKNNHPFVEAITKTMVEERAGPGANRILFKEFNIKWHPIPQNQGGVRS
jgi:hypothetical protein